MQASQIRGRFLAFFEERGHTVVPSASLIPPQDPTLLFVNAGMVPFKDVFLGKEKRPYVRAASAQKCMRVSGKHNDLEEVGPSPRHHTFFEMLGNFSFGDYFKEEAIGFSWEFLTKEMGLPPDALHPTVYEEDPESAEIWSRVKGMPVGEVVRLGADDNFWSMGDTGPCGPNSEIIYDRSGACLRDGSDCPLTCDCDRWWELWNNVFMQFERSSDGTLTPLPKNGVDTGLGFERLCASVQGVESNYETDLFLPLFDRLREFTNDSGELAPDRLPAYRAVADHARAVTFLIADNIMPSNGGRGYVLRRVLRRASYHGRLLGVERPFLAKICAGVVEIMGDAYPELHESESRILELVSDEEERFLNTLDAGLTRLDRVFEEVKAAGGPNVLSGDEAFRLYDTFGFPIDLTRKVLEARDWSVDEEEFERAMGEQRERGRGAREQEAAEEATLLAEVRKLPATRFAGYESLEAQANVLVIVGAEGRTDVANEGDQVELVLDTTPFYAEGGGQVADAGRIAGPDGELEVEHVRSAGDGIYVHTGRVARGRLAEGDSVQANVDEPSRRATVRNHTATHLLHRALRDVLGEQAKQAGSLVAPDRLRFDFLHTKPLTEQELRETERIVQEQVLLNQPVRTDVMPVREALDLGADAMFDEKYGQDVRVVSVGEAEPFSRELCGGTHCRASGEIGAFFIVDQRSVGAGVRRLEGVTGRNAYRWMDEHRTLVDQLSREYSASLAELPDRLRTIAERAREQPKPAAAMPEPAALLERAERRDGTLLIVEKIDAPDAAPLRDFGDELRRRAESAAVVLGSLLDGKPTVLVMLTDDLVKGGMHAGDLAKQIGKQMGAGGGGRPDSAQAGGRDPSQLDAALARARELLRQGG